MSLQRIRIYISEVTNNKCCEMLVPDSAGGLAPERTQYRGEKN